MNDDEYMTSRRDTRDRRRRSYIPYWYWYDPYFYYYYPAYYWYYYYYPYYPYYYGASRNNQTMEQSIEPPQNINLNNFNTSSIKPNTQELLNHVKNLVKMTGENETEILKMVEDMVTIQNKFENNILNQDEMQTVKSNTQKLGIVVHKKMNVNGWNCVQLLDNVMICNK